MMMLSLGAFAQHEVGTLTLQPKVGVNLASMTDTDDSSMRIGLVAGGEFEYQATNFLGVSAGMLYSMQGVKGDVAGGDLTIKTDYINIPVLANIYVAKGLALKVGIQPGFNVSGKYKASAPSSWTSSRASNNGVSISGDLSDIGTEVNSFDFAIPVGLSYEFNDFVIDGRYNIGMSKAIKDEDTKHNVIQLTLGYKFAL